MSNKTNNKWTKLFDELPIDSQPTAEQQGQAKQRALDVFTSEASHTLHSRLQYTGQILMKYKAPQWTAAASAMFFLIWFAIYGNQPAFALEDVVKNMSKARNARFDMVVQVTGAPKQTMKAFFMEPSHFRQELTNGYVNIADWSAGKMIGLDAKSKRATVLNIINAGADAKQGTQQNQFEMIRERLKNAIDDPNKKVESLGEKTIAGKKLLGFRFQDAHQPMTVWVNAETKFPVEIQATMVGPPETKVVMSNYEFNIDLDKSLFSLKIPNGYEIIETDVDASPVTEEEFVSVLKQCSSAMDGELPKGFDAAAMGSYIGKFFRTRAIDRTKGPDADQMKAAVKISRGFRFVLTMPVESDAHYAGHLVEKDSKSTAIFWYKPEGKSKYRILYSDFSVKEADTAPMVVGANPVSSQAK